MAAPVAPQSTIDAIGRYTIERLLGVGAMGSVYLAYDTRLCRRVALKVLNAEAHPLGGDAVAATLREARAAGAISHPNATAVFDADQADGHAYIVMELVPGTPLRALIGDPAVLLATRLRWLVDMAGALAAAHAVGVVHRDVKPENVLIRDDGVVKVLDFGVARFAGGDDPRSAIGGRATWTQDGGLVGTPGYMAPEVLRGLPVDGRADQFGWGVVAYELLSGKLPWRRSETAFGAIAAALTQDPDPLGPDIPPPVAAVIERALAKTPEERFPSLDVAASLLSAFAEPTSLAFRVPPESQACSPPPPDALPPSQRAPRVPLDTLTSATARSVEHVAPTRPAPSSSPPSPLPVRPSSPPRAPSSRPDAPPSLPRFPLPPLPVRPSSPPPPRAPSSRPPDPRGDLPPPDEQPATTLASGPRSEVLSPRPGFRPPNFAAPVDLEAHLALLPPAASVKGMFFLDLLAQAERLRSPRELAALAGIPERRYVAFRDYPMADNMRLTVAVARILHPRLPLGEALRRRGQRALGVLLESHLGRSLFGVFDPDPEPFLLHGFRAYRLLIGLGEVSVERLSPHEYRLNARGMPLFLETYQIGVLESVLMRCNVRGEVLIAMDGLSDATVLLRLRP